MYPVAGARIYSHSDAFIYRALPAYGLASLESATAAARIPPPVAIAKTVGVDDYSGPSSNDVTGRQRTMKFVHTGKSCGEYCLLRHQRRTLTLLKECLHRPPSKPVSALASRAEILYAGVMMSMTAIRSKTGRAQSGYRFIASPSLARTRHRWFVMRWAWS